MSCCSSRWYAMLLDSLQDHFHRLPSSTHDCRCNPDGKPHLSNRLRPVKGTQLVEWIAPATQGQKQPTSTSGRFGQPSGVMRQTCLPRPSNLSQRHHALTDKESACHKSARPRASCKLISRMQGHPTSTLPPLGDPVQELSQGCDVGRFAVTLVLVAHRPTLVAHRGDVGEPSFGGVHQHLYLETLV